MKLNLYLVQDQKRQTYVVAESWKDAIQLWKDRIAYENEITAAEVLDPMGVQFLAGTDNLYPKLLLPGGVA